MLVLLAIACGPEAQTPATRSEGRESWTLPYIGGQSGEDPGYATCDPVAVVSEEEVVSTADGDLTGAGLRALAEGVHLADLSWWDAPPTELRVDLWWDGEIRRLGPSATTTATPCAPGLEIDGSYTLATEDGRLLQEGEVTLSSTRPSLAVFAPGWAEGDATVQMEAWIDSLGLHGVIWRFTEEGVVQIASFGR